MPSSSGDALGVKFVYSGLSGMAAELATFPIDITKTRMQLMGELQTGARARGAFATVADIVKTKGVRGLYAGSAPAVLRHFPYTGTRILAYEVIGRQFGQAEHRSMATSITTGMASGALGQLVAVPADLVKVRMQADSRLDKPRYTGMRHAFSTIVHEHGVRGLWTGTLPAVQRAALVNLGELATYDQAKRFVMSKRDGQDDLGTHVASAVMSGAATLLRTH